MGEGGEDVRGNGGGRTDSWAGVLDLDIMPPKQYPPTSATCESPFMSKRSSATALNLQFGSFLR